MNMKILFVKDSVRVKQYGILAKDNIIKQFGICEISYFGSNKTKIVDGMRIKTILKVEMYFYVNQKPTLRLSVPQYVERVHFHSFDNNKNNNSF